MRIGRVIIDTDNMDIEEIDTLIKEFKKIRARKVKERELVNRLNELIADATVSGFAFAEKDFGQVLREGDFVLYDECKEQTSVYFSRRRISGRPADLIKIFL